jgi:hypothetical protein
VASARLVVELRLRNPPSLLPSVKSLKSLSRRHHWDLGAAGDVHVAVTVLAKSAGCEPEDVKVTFSDIF